MSWFSSRKVTEDDLVDLGGKVAIVTGGNTGIGYATVQFLARKGAKVYMAARNRTKALSAIEQLKAEGIAEGSVEWLELDLAEPALSKKAAEIFLTRESRLDILVNNAARGAQEPVELDQCGLPNMFITNCISPYIFTRTLIPIITETAKGGGTDVRIINVSSGIHTRSHPTTLNKASISGSSETVWTLPKRLELYGLCKLAALLHVKQLQRNFSADSIPVTCMAVNPGAINTEGSTSFLETVPYISFVLKLMSRYFFGTWRDGAMNVAWAAAGKEINDAPEQYYGKYVVPVVKIGAPSNEASTERLARELLVTMEEVVTEMGL